ncbi:uncharacterized protein KY384_001215 [Bacidia gigantensis]|uniref:uncharacterized protein n=1 Tax=Bacidia gigantensis TaxID=2732470 RepID=UPI001D052B01|nr:uncharacterized protein KY384_001215 [Bacidia gigantensis]KAG8534370.1 hypothetical protein KY384_001215 [Bacidia gigantensis]
MAASHDFAAPAVDRALTMNIDQPVAGGFVLPGTRQKRRQNSASDEERLKFISKLPPGYRGHLVAVLGEFVGTFLFLFFALSGTQVANTWKDPGDPARLMYVSLCFGFSLAVNAWVFFRISGGLFNPAVTFGMCIVGALTYVRGALVTVAQILGAIASAGVVGALFPGPLQVDTQLGGGTSISQGLFIEMFLTAMLVFAIFMLAAEKNQATFIAPVGIGLALFIAELTGVFFTGGSLNPARSFGPAVVNRSFDGYHWIYWVGPFLGALLAAAFYKFIKMLEYETANPSPDLERQRMIDSEDETNGNQDVLDLPAVSVNVTGYRDSMNGPEDGGLNNVTLSQAQDKDLQAKFDIEVEGTNTVLKVNTAGRTTVDQVKRLLHQCYVEICAKPHRAESFGYYKCSGGGLEMVLGKVWSREPTWQHFLDAVDGLYIYCVMQKHPWTMSLQVLSAGIKVASGGVTDAPHGGQDLE